MGDLLTIFLSDAVSRKIIDESPHKWPKTLDNFHVNHRLFYFLHAFASPKTNRNKWKLPSIDCRALIVHGGSVDFAFAKSYSSNNNCCLSNDYILHTISVIAGMIRGLCAANERRHYFVTASLIGWAQALESALWLYVASQLSRVSYARKQPQPG